MPVTCEVNARESRRDYPGERNGAARLYRMNDRTSERACVTASRVASVTVGQVRGPVNDPDNLVANIELHLFLSDESISILRFLFMYIDGISENFACGEKLILCCATTI